MIGVVIIVVVRAVAIVLWAGRQLNGLIYGINGSDHAKLYH